MCINIPFNERLYIVKKISLIQPNFQTGPKQLNAYFLPYSVGSIWVSATLSDIIKNNYILDKVVWRREDIDETVNRLKDNYAVAFSCYIWNRNYNYTLAKQLKESNPNIIIIFGGPEPPITKSNIFELYPYIDYVVKKEGEYTFRLLLENLVSDNNIDVAGLLVNHNGRVIDTGEGSRINTLDDLPSPYLTGFFDNIISQNPDIEWTATLETNRGCPYACTFCDWGSLTYAKVKQFSLQRVYDEIEWIGQHKCGFLVIADANFGMFVERDSSIADKINEVQKKYGYPYSFNTNWAKNQKQDIIDVVKKLNSGAKGNKGLTISVQTLTEPVLDNIKRKNLGQHNISEIFALCEKNNIPVDTEVILGLPGETIETWKKTIYDLFNYGNHTGISIYQLQVLENAELNLTQKIEHNIETVLVYDYMSGSYNNVELQESVEVVISTKDMPFSDMLNAQVFNWFVNTFHINGLTTYIARILNKKYNISYEKFYDDLFEFIKTDSWLLNEMLTTREYYNKWMTSGHIGHPSIGNIEIHGWNLLHKTIIKMHAEERHDDVFKVLLDFLLTYNIDYNVAVELIEFQKNFNVQYKKLSSYPIIKNYSIDVIGYLSNKNEIEHPVTVTFEVNEDKNMSLQLFLDHIYFSRRRNFGKAKVFILNT